MKIKLMVLFLIRSLVNAQRLSLVVGMFERIPGYFKEDNLTVAYDQHGNVGVWIYGIQWLSERLNFEYQIVPMLDKKLGQSQLINGSGPWSGALGDLQNGNIDLLGPPNLLSLARHRSFDFAGVADEEKSALITPPLTEQSSILSTLRPFTPTVWMMLVISLFSVALSYTVIETISDKVMKLKRFPLFNDHIFSTLASLTNQGQIFPKLYNRYSLPFRLTNAAWCLFAVVMVNLYSSTLTSYITIRKTNAPPKNSFEVIEQGILKYLILDNGIGRELILGATSGSLKKMGDVFRRHPENFVRSQEECFLKVTTGCCACSDLLSFLEYRLGEDFKKTGKCRVYIGKPTSGYNSVGLLLKKRSPYSKAINQGLLEMYQSGFVEHWRKLFVRPEAAACKGMKKKLKKLRSLNLRDLASAFFILNLGYLFSLCCFLVEQLGRFSHRRRC